MKYSNCVSEPESDGSCVDIVRVREKGRTLFENCGTVVGVKVISNSNVITLDLVATKRLYTARGFFLQYQGRLNLTTASHSFIFIVCLKSNLSEMDRTWYEQTFAIAQWISHPEITLTSLFSRHRCAWKRLCLIDFYIYQTYKIKYLEQCITITIVIVRYYKLCCTCFHSLIITIFTCTI